MTEKWRHGWLSDTIGREYGKLFYKRAVGELPEMESSKAAAKRVKAVIRPGDSVLDAGCGAGHYLRSLASIVDTAFSYTGVDATPGYIEAAREAFASRPDTSFHVADIFNLPFEDGSFDIVMSNNVLLHLPSVAKPLAELGRVARRHVLVRTLVGESSFRVMEVIKGQDGRERFDESGEPEAFSFVNIYAKDYVEELLRCIPSARSWSITPDRDFDPALLDQNPSAHESANLHNVTRMVGDWQVSGYILMPWCFIDIEIG